MSVDTSTQTVARDQPGRHDAPPVAWTENRAAPGWMPRLDLRELWAYRELAAFLAARDLQLRYKQTFFGVAWAVLQPVAAAGIFGLFLGRLAGLPSDGYPYLPFVFSGLVAWLYISTAVTAAARSLVDQRPMVTKVYFPRLLAPLAAVLPGLLDLLISLVIMAGILVVSGVSPGLALVTLPLWIGAAVGVAAAIGILLAALNALYRDVQFALTFVLQAWLFASPVVYPTSLVHGDAKALFALNPMVGVIDGFRWALLDDPTLGPHDLVSLAVTLLVLVFGVGYFQRVDRTLADRI
jgi:lipopolysaccharide transport system permease protein